MAWFRGEIILEGRNLEAIMRVVRRREEVGAVVLLVAVIEGQQIGYALASLCVFRTSMPKNTHSN